MKAQQVINKVKALIKAGEDTPLSTNWVEEMLKAQLELIILVDKNYKHIKQLETLIALFKGGLSPYEEEYYPLCNEMTLLLSYVADTTRLNKYKDTDGITAQELYDTIFKTS